MTAEALTLFDTPPIGAHRRTDTASAVEAAATCDAARQRDRLLSTLSASRHGLSADDLETATGIPRYIVASRLAQMKRDFQCAPFGFGVNGNGKKVQLWWRTTPPRVVDVPVGTRL